MLDINDLIIGPCVGIFGEPVSYRRAIDQVVSTVTGVFDEAYLELTPLGHGSIPGTEGFSLGSPGAISEAMPVLGIQVAQFSVPPRQNDLAIIRGETYVVKEFRPDGHGGAKLLLNLYSGSPCW